MFKIGQRVVYGSHGVCDIVDIDTKIIDKKKVEYFVLTPLEQPGARFYIPVGNPVALEKMRPLLTWDELESLLHSEEAARDTWIPDENRRKLIYRELISRGSPAELICMIRNLHRHRADQLAAGRKFHLCDENFLRDAEQLIRSEFSLVLGIEKNCVGPYIEEVFEKGHC